MSEREHDDLISRAAIYERAMDLYRTGEIDSESLNDIINLIDEQKSIVAVEVTTSCEDASKTYLTLPDGLRIILENGQYAGWYVCGEKDGE